MKVKDMNKIFRFFTIKYWKDYKRLKHILKCIKNAKKHFIKDRNKNNIHSFGLCHYLGTELYGELDYTYYKINKTIPVFTPQFFNVNKDEHSYWWKIYDVESRINAFNKLIHHYKKLIKEL